MSQKPTFDYDYIVIGSGAGGSPAASILASAGKKVVFVEKINIRRGITKLGRCTNWILNSRS